MKAIGAVVLSVLFSAAAAQTSLSLNPNLNVVSYSQLLGVLVDAAYRVKPGNNEFATAKVTLGARARSAGRRCKANAFEFLRWDSPYPAGSLGRNRQFRQVRAKLLADVKRDGWTVRALPGTAARERYLFTRGKVEMLALMTDSREFLNVYELLLCRLR